MLELEKVTKRYGSVTALSEFSFSFPPGFYGLLGENGSGKSTLIELIAGNLKPDDGRILWNGREPAALGASFRAKIGYMPQEAAFYEEMTGFSFLAYLAGLKGLPKKGRREEIEEKLRQVHLLEDSGRKIRGYSGGMRQRLFLAQALLGNPEILLLDEPTAGMDPTDRQSVVRSLREASQTCVVLLSTHIISDIEQTADQVLFLQKGKLVLSGTLPEVLSRPVIPDGEGMRNARNLEELYRFYYPEEKRRERA